MVDNCKFKIGDKIYKPKGYKFPGTVVSVFKTTLGETRIVAEMSDNGMLHIFNESQLELMIEPELLPTVTECERVAISMINNAISEKKITRLEAKEKVTQVIEHLMSDQQLPAFLIDYWSNIKIEVDKIQTT